MKKRIVLPMLGIGIFFAAAVPGRAQDKAPMKAEVELVVRVFDGARPVSGLTAEQFRLSEDGEAREIRGFSENARGLGAGSGAGAQVKPRCFALAFTIFEYDDRLRAALDRLFAGILRPQDQLLVFADRGFLDFPEVGGGGETRAAIDRLLAERAAAGRLQIDRFVQEFAKVSDMREFRRGMLGDDEGFRMRDFLRIYTDTWKEYRRRFLYPDREMLRQLARKLAGIGMEKWLVAFQQLEVHSHVTMGKPEFRLIDNLITRMQDLQVRIESEASSFAQSERNLRRQKTETEKALMIPDDFPGDEMRQIVGQANTPCHVIMIPAVRGRAGESSKFDLGRVTGGIEQAVREAVRGSGGTLAVTSDPAAAVAAMAGASDVYYRMVYTAEVKKEGRVRIDVLGKRYTLVYDEVPLVGAPAASLAAGAVAAPETATTPAAGPGTLRIAGARFEKKRLFLEFGGYSLAKEGRKIVGRVNIHVRLEDNNTDQTVFDQGRDMVCDKADLVLAIDLPQLPAGFYTLTVDVRDLLSGQQASENQSLQIE